MLGCPLRLQYSIVCLVPCSLEYAFILRAAPLCSRLVCTIRVPKPSKSTFQRRGGLSRLPFVQMGKQKRNRRRKARAARAPVPVTLVSAEEQFEEQTKTKVTPLVKQVRCCSQGHFPCSSVHCGRWLMQMTSGTSTARMVACDAVASMVTEDKGVSALLRLRCRQR